MSKRGREHVGTLWRAIGDHDPMVRCTAAEKLLGLYGLSVDETLRCGDLLGGLASTDLRQRGLAKSALRTLINALDR